MKPSDQPCTFADSAEDAKPTENKDENIIADADPTAETRAELATMIRNTPALTTN